ncbi:MAG: response regulator [Sandaracinaceae bacterium]|nr:response regulator [Sandaracinaceae bacterium]
MTRLLVVAPRATSRGALRELLPPEHGIVEAATADEALTASADAGLDAAFVSEETPDVERLLGALRQRGIGTVVVGAADASAVVRHLRAGADDCVDAANADRGALTRALSTAVERTLAARETALIRRLWERMPLGVIVLEACGEPDGLRVAYQNQAGRAVRASGVAAEGVIPGMSPTALREITGRVLLSGEPARLSPIELDATSDGAPARAYEAHISRLDGRSVLILLEDVTELLVTRRQLDAASRMEAIGRLAGGVAHDFNNMLTVISGHAGFMREGLAPDDPSHEDASAILDAASRSAELTRQLLAFSRRQIRAPRVLELNGTVESIQPLLRRIIGEHISLTTRLDARAGAIEADPAQIEQVLMNLAVNARDAMPRGGSLQVETLRRVVREAFRPGSFAVQPGEYAELRVIDEGVGMSPETLARMFEPFFTTKSKDEGTGLGLATVYGIVKQSNGCVWAESALGTGTTFFVLFPRVEAAPTAMPALGPRDTLPGGETILFVEDERLVRRAIRRILETAGYRVVEAALPSQALAVDVPVDLVLTDIVMPEMSGRELAARLAARVPRARVLFTSGYTMDEAGGGDVLTPGTPFIAKPFTRQALLEAVHEALSKGPALEDLAGRG